MKRILSILFLLTIVTNLFGQTISHIETTKSWYYIYDQDGKKIRTISTSQGELMAYSANFYIIKQGSAFYITYGADGKRLHAFSVSQVGEILNASGDTFTSKTRSWIYTWTKDGKKVATRTTSGS